MKALYIYPHESKKVNNNYYHPHLNEILDRYRYIANDLTVIISDGKLNDFSRFNKSSVINDRLVIFPKINNIKNLIFKSKKNIIDEIKKADLVITKLPSFEGNIAVKYAHKYDKKILVEVVGCVWDALWNHSFKGKLIAPYMFFKTRSNVRRADYVMYVTNDFLQKRYPNYNYNIGCSDVFIKDHKFNQDKYNNIFNKDKIVLGTLAAIDTKYKSQDEIIKLLPFLNKKFTHVEYHLAGKGDSSFLKSVAKKYGVEDKVKFLGLLDKRGVYNLLDDIDFYIQPSKTEGLCRSLIEAMSMSCVCIAANVGGNNELLDHDFIYPKDNLTSLKDIFNKLSEDSVKKNSSYNYQKSLDFSQEIIKEKREVFYNQVLSDLQNTLLSH